jgi:hypothetical protein
MTKSLHNEWTLLIIWKRIFETRKGTICLPSQNCFWTFFSWCTTGSHSIISYTLFISNFICISTVFYHALWTQHDTETFPLKQTFILPYLRYQDVVLDPLNLCLAMYDIYLMYHIWGFAYSWSIHVPPLRTAAQVCPWRWRHYVPLKHQTARCQPRRLQYLFCKWILPEKSKSTVILRRWEFREPVFHPPRC